VRYFASDADVCAIVRATVMQSLGQPNGQADEPWRVGADFSDGQRVYLALGPHHTEGKFWAPMIAAALEAGVQEVAEAEYMAARPQPEGDM